MAITRNITIEQGTTVSLSFTALDAVGGNRIQITGKTINAEMKRMFNAYSAYEFTVTIDEDPQDAETFGDFTISMTAEYSSQIEGGRYVYDIEIDDAGTITRIYEGLAICKPQVSTGNPYSNVQGIKQFAPNTVHVHENKLALDKVRSCQLITEDYEALDGDKLIVDCTDASVRITVPVAPSVGFTLCVIDADETFAINPVIFIHDGTEYPYSVGGDFIQTVYTNYGYKTFSLGGSPL